MKQERPVFLDLTKIRFPITAIASILHRISGFIVFLLIPLILWMGHSATTAAGFSHLQADFANPFLRLFTWIIVSALIYHLLAGVKHLLADAHLVGENLSVAKTLSTSVIVLAAILIILAGVWLW